MHTTRELSELEKGREREGEGGTGERGGRDSQKETDIKAKSCLKG